MPFNKGEYFSSTSKSGILSCELTAHGFRSTDDIRLRRKIKKCFARRKKSFPCAIGRKRADPPVGAVISREIAGPFREIGRADSGRRSLVRVRGKNVAFARRIGASGRRSRQRGTGSGGFWRQRSYLFVSVAGDFRGVPEKISAGAHQHLS